MNKLRKIINTFIGILSIHGSAFFLYCLFFAPIEEIYLHDKRDLEWTIFLVFMIMVCNFLGVYFIKDLFVKRREE